MKNKNSGMDVERPMKQSSSATIFHVSCFKCGLNFESKEDLTSHVSVCMEQGMNRTDRQEERKTDRLIDR